MGKGLGLVPVTVTSSGAGGGGCELQTGPRDCRVVILRECACTQPAFCHMTGMCVYTACILGTVYNVMDFNGLTLQTVAFVM